MTIQSINIEGRRIGAGCPAYLVAEISANHGRDPNRAAKLIEAAKEAGADAVKLQTYTPDTMTIDSDRAPFRIQGTPWDGRLLYDLYREASTPWEWHATLQDIARRIGLTLFSTAFDDTAVDLLERLQVPAYKIASFENVDLPLLRRVARTGKPVMLSTGLATLGELDEAVETLRGAGAVEMALLKCTSAYPAPDEDLNLRTLPHLATTFRMPVGLSDHSMEVAVPVVAVTLGACIIEKHFTLSRELPGPDSSFSLEPGEFRAMVTAVRTAEQALGTIRYGITDAERANLKFRRSLFVVRDVKKGEAFTAENIRAIRPGSGLHTRYQELVIGRAAAVDILRGTPLNWNLVGAAPASGV